MSKGVSRTETRFAADLAPSLDCGANGLAPRTPTHDARIPLEFRTLSIQVYDSQHWTAGKHPGKNDHDPNAFEGVEFHKISPESLCHQFNVSPDRGLDVGVASRRLLRDGKNTLAATKTHHLRNMFGYVFGGFCSILWVGVIIFFLCWRPLSDPPSPTNLALAIVVILVIALQASFSAFQDWSTGRVMNSILDLLPSNCVVVRDGETVKVPSAELVVGDLVRLASGDKVPADMRIIRSSGDIKFDRSILTGESLEVTGTVDMTDDNFLETRNIALMGTHVVNGSADAIVVFVGGRTVMGRISHLTNSAKEEPTLIQKEISRFVMIIIVLTALLALLILLAWAGWLRIKHPAFLNVVGMLNNVMGCVVAFIPEGMPIGVALTLSLVARRMKAASVLPKSLSTVETLGCVNVICSDKTGTLTSGRMTAVTVGFVDKTIAVDELVADFAQKASSSATLRELHRAVVLCTSASFDSASAHLPLAERQINGDATDSAVFLLGERLGDADQVRQAQRRVFQIPFNSKNKWMVSVNETLGATSTVLEKRRLQLFVKGAPDVLTPRCTSYWSHSKNEIIPFDFNARQSLLRSQTEWSSQGQRVIMLCTRDYVSPTSVESNDFGDDVAENGLSSLTIIGLVGIVDPPRPETFETVRDCRRAGARFFMVTGDFGLTASAIARQVGIFTNERQPDDLQDLKTTKHESFDVDSGGSTDSGPFIPKSLVLEGKDFVNIEEPEWDLICRYEEIVFARTTPEQKLKIVVELKRRDFVVAVTGDGVNDAPALRAADVGIAMVNGSDVAIEAANLVLLGSFASIVEGIRLGRLVFQNLQKVIGYLLPAGSWSEIWPVLLNVFTGLPLPLSSFLMIIICCFTDCFPCLTLIMEKEEFDLLSLPPRDAKRDHLINFRIYAQSYLFIGVIETVIAHAMYFLYYWKTAGIPPRALFLAFETYTEGFYGYSQDALVNLNNTAQSVYFVTLVILQWGNLLSIRNKRLSILQADPFRQPRRNLWLFGGMIASFAIAVFVTECEGIQTLFLTASVPIEFWVIPVPLALGLLMMDETRKLVVRTWPNGPIARIAW